MYMYMSRPQYQQNEKPMGQKQQNINTLVEELLNLPKGSVQRPKRLAGIIHIGLVRCVIVAVFRTFLDFREKIEISSSEEMDSPLLVRCVRCSVLPLVSCSNTSSSKCQSNHFISDVFHDLDFWFGCRYSSVVVFRQSRHQMFKYNCLPLC